MRKVGGSRAHVQLVIKLDVQNVNDKKFFFFLTSKRELMSFKYCEKIQTKLTGLLFVCLYFSKYKKILRIIKSQII